MVKLYSILRLILQFSLFLIYGKYLEEVVSFPFLIISFFLINLLTIILYKLKLRTLPAVFLILLTPWIIRSAVVLINIFDRSFLQISFDMNFYLILFPLYISASFTWFSLVRVHFRKFEVLLNGIFLYILFWKQSNYKITLVPNPAYLAVFTIIFILFELLVLYLSIYMERSVKKKPLDSIKEFSLFFTFLIPLIIYLLLPLWDVYEEGSVAGGGGLLKSSMFRFDFSEYIKLETEISMSDDLVLMYRKEGPAERMLLRRYVLSGYERGDGFFRHERDKISPPDKLLPRYAEFEDPGYGSREKVHQELFLVNIDPTAFLSLNYPINSQPIYNWDNSSFVRIYQSEAMVTSKIRDVFPEITMDGDNFRHYTYTGEDKSMLELAETITENTPGNFLKTLEIEDYFLNNYFYSLKPGVAPDGDQLSYFINDSQKGYCSYFAFSMALLCRSLGIPSRVAVGFWVDPEVSVLNFYPVRADQAHAWVEVYFDDYGWVEFDPTSSTMYPGEQYPFASFTIDEFSPFIEEILEHEMIPENLSETEDIGRDIKKEKGPLKLFYRFVGRWWFLIVTGGYLLFIVLYRYSFSILFMFNRTERGRAKYLYLSIRSKLSFERKGYKESLLDYARKVEIRLHVPLEELTELYLKSVFSPRFTQIDLENLIVHKEKSLKEYRKRIPLWKRIFFFVFPFFRSWHR